MRIFISWSGPRSLAVAEALRDWLPLVIQSVQPFLSSKDIRAGQSWFTEISEHLKESNFGICCVTPGNQSEPWLNFEAGAIAKEADRSRVVAYLMDNMQPTDLTGPLKNFQSKPADRQGTWETVQSINESMDHTLSPHTLRTTFDAFWSQLGKKLESLPEEEVEPTAPRTSDDMVPEILNLVRMIASSPLPSAEARGAEQVGFINQGQQLVEQALWDAAEQAGESFSIDDLLWRHHRGSPKITLMVRANTKPWREYHLHSVQLQYFTESDAATLATGIMTDPRWSSKPPPSTAASAKKNSPSKKAKRSISPKKPAASSIQQIGKSAPSPPKAKPS